MSATPIPRTLALIIYGDLDVSVIDELPPGRQKVDTFAVDESYRRRLYAFIEKQAFEGRQTFVVCPMIDENDELPGNIKSARSMPRSCSAISAQAQSRLHPRQNEGPGQGGRHDRLCGR
jgi:RecG-like helicase